MASSITTSNKTPTSSSATSNQSRAADNGISYSAGATAGIGVAGAIAGALFASAILLLLYFLRCRRHRRPSSFIQGEKEQHFPMAAPFSNARSEGEIGVVLPQPVSDSEIKEKMTNLRTAVKGHIASFYHKAATTVDEAALKTIITDSGISLPEMADALSATSHRRKALQYLIGSVMFSRVGFECHPSTSFLPPDLLGCFQSIQAVRSHRRDDGTMPLSCWRATTAQMLHPAYARQLSSTDPRLRAINAAAQLLEPVLLALATDGTGEQRRDHLAEVFKEAARFGFLLFSQTSVFEFDWGRGRALEPGSFVCWPALVQIADSNGQPLGQGRILVDMEVSHGSQG